MAWDRRAAVVLRVARDAVGRWGWLRGACNRRVNVRVGVGCQDTICSGLLVTNAGAGAATAPGVWRMRTAAGSWHVADLWGLGGLCAFRGLLLLLLLLLLLAVVEVV